jgi:hypothetical protein
MFAEIKFVCLLSVSVAEKDDKSLNYESNLLPKISTNNYYIFLTKHRPKILYRFCLMNFKKRIHLFS